MTHYVIYSRKSQEDDDKQIQSIPSQEDEMKSVASRLNLTVIKPLLNESKSAKAPGRPVFNEMMKRVEKGEIRGILCWKLDRLARNPVDGGRIIWAVKQNSLIIQTPHQTFSKAKDNIILMYIEFGMAQKYVDDLSLTTSRGLEKKAKLGWFPGIAPVGYLNSKVEERGNKTIFRDPVRFDAVRRMWDLMLAGNASPARIQKLANEEWGFRTRQTKKTGGKPLSRSTIYKIFSDSFYCGRFEYPKGSGKLYQGRHEPMVTEAEFDSVQKLLRRETNPRPQTEFALPYRGTIKCGECGSSITAHFKEQVRCTRCRFKSSIKNRTSCSKCGLALSDMKTPIVRRYGYYHCTRTLSATCRQKCISATDLEKQVAEKLKPFGLPPELRDWGLQCVEKMRDHDLVEKKQTLAEKKKAFDKCVSRLDNLVKLWTAPENTAGSLLSDEEYQRQRADLLAQKSKLATDTSTFESELEAKTNRVKDLLNVAGRIGDQSFTNDAGKRREVLCALGLNHVLKEKELEIRPEFPFSDLPNQRKPEQRNLRPIEPDIMQRAQGQNGDVDSACPRPEQEPDEGRTKALKMALDLIWKKSGPLAEFNKKYSITEVARKIPIRRKKQAQKDANVPVRCPRQTH